MSHLVFYDENKSDKNVSLKDLLNTPDNSDIGWKWFEKILWGKKEKKAVPFCLENKTDPKDEISEFMNEMKANAYTQNTKLIYDWTDKKENLTRYGILKFFDRHGMRVDRNHEINSFKQNMCLESYISFSTQKRNEASGDFEKCFFKLLNVAFFGKTMQNVRIRKKVLTIKKDEDDKMVTWQSKLTFVGS